MTAMDTRARATALRLLNKYGKACVLKQITSGVYDPETATIPRVTTSHPVKAFLEGPNQKDLDSGLVVATDEMAIFAAQSLLVEPAVNDRFTVGSSDRTVQAVFPVWSGEQVALWRVGLRS